MDWGLTGLGLTALGLTVPGLTVPGLTVPGREDPVLADLRGGAVLADRIGGAWWEAAVLRS